MTDSPIAVAASAWVTTEQESNLPPAATAAADVDDATAEVLVGALENGADAAGLDEDGELHAATKATLPHAIAEIATRQCRIS